MIVSWVLTIVTLELAGMYTMRFFGARSDLTCIIGGALIAVLLFGVFAIGAVIGSIATLKEMRFVDDGKPKDEIVLKFLGWERRFKMKHEVTE